MVFESIGSNYGTRLNFVLNPGGHKYICSVWKITQINQLFVMTSSLFANQKSDFDFVISSKEDSKNLCIHNRKTTNPITDQFFYEYKFRNSHLSTHKLIHVLLMRNTKKQNSFLHQSTRCSCLFSQIRKYKTEKNANKDDLGIKTKDFLGLGVMQSKSKAGLNYNLNKFNNSLLKEKLTPEENQRALLAYIEGYIIGQESVLPKKPSKLFVYFLWAALVAGLINLTLLYKSGQLPIFGQLTDSLTAIEMIETDVKFTDVKGADEAKQELKNVVEFLKNPEKFSSLGGKLPKGVLLVGPPGTGKTLLAKAVAGEAGVPFFSKSGPEFDEVYVGVGARRIRELFQMAKENVPCVIFIDEIDSIGKERTSSAQHPHANDTINQLLTEMDGFRTNAGIIILGATNRKDDLDRALLRPGRFDVEVNVTIPDYVGRKELFDHYLDKIRHQEVNVERLARGTTNFTGADIENMVNQAALRAAIMEAKSVTMEHLEYTRDKALMGPEKISRILDEETNRITAYHEGGHALVAYFTKHAQPLHKVTIIARGSSLGHTSYIPDKDVYHVTKTELLAMIDTMMGGRAAEELIFGPEKITSGAASDLQKATDLASKMVMKWGMSDEVGLTTYSNQTLMSPQTANSIDMEVKKILSESYERAKNILRTHYKKHRELSEALIKYETLDAEEIRTIMKGNPIKRPT